MNYNEMWEFLPHFKLISSFWQNMRALLAPAGTIIVDTIPAFFEGKACHCNRPLSNTVCSRPIRLGVEICWLRDFQALSLLFDYFIHLVEKEGLRLIQPVFLDDTGKMGIKLQRVD
ncbi:unnamed protein product [Vitrella brassicaformis CCMP3155]|uniref:Uncharacterized protein n=2 Tax=Vitrella brassicaformis TaxID=1169539 RepID=A0A0G4EU13_VITBC|nr:unnamed protein product [Vitrella brassicaformis CCMP3155]|mmetsp:Transcript_31769/g.78764  ORF Transcript_31769/g.78764 Transcript_31769/m.78764 type:complete len:116 (+) Transcript_31769:711-1058(+)|eukprot:CEM02122.1 unnamed protein product [Vitrella brassicaformis CCMP3155]